MLLKWIFNLLLLLWVYQTFLRPWFLNQQHGAANRPAPGPEASKNKSEPPPKESSPPEKDADFGGEYIDYEEIK